MTQLRTASAPVEIDDPMRDVEDLTPLLEVPDKYSAKPASRVERPIFSSTEDTDVLPRTPQHRRQPTSAARGRVWIAAMAAGAAAAAAYTMATPRAQAPTTRTVLASEKTPIEGTPANRGVELVTVKPAAGAAVHAEELSKGVAYAAARAEREARLQRPLFVMPTRGIFTSGFGYRWGALHGGVDLAGPVGTPIYAA
ncbi:MAG: M23 family metallopeptidase, partial [Mycobacterium sp.]